MSFTADNFNPESSKILRWTVLVVLITTAFIIIDHDYALNSIKINDTSKFLHSLISIILESLVPYDAIVLLVLVTLVTTTCWLSFLIYNTLHSKQ